MVESNGSCSSSDSSVSSMDATCPTSRSDELNDFESDATDLIAICENLEYFSQTWNPDDYPGRTVEEAFQEFLCSKQKLYANWENNSEDSSDKELGSETINKGKEPITEKGKEPIIENPSEKESKKDEKWNGHGVRLEDFEIDIFCDRLQRAAREQNQRIDGCMAIQSSLHLLNFQPFVTGQNIVLQVVFDQSRTGHFILLEWTPVERVVIIYDSLVPTTSTVNNTFSEFVVSQIINIFGFLDDNPTIAIRIERNIPKQTDSWSCGLRAIGFLTRRAFNLPATGINYDLEQLHNFLQLIKVNYDSTMDDFQYIHFCTIDYPPPKNLPPIQAELNKATRDLRILPIECLKKKKKKKSFVYDVHTQ